MNKDDLTIVTGILSISIIFALILMFTGKARFDEARLSELRRELYEQRIDNENLRYQLDQCKILYRGM